MDSGTYAKLRREVGSQEEVAGILGVHVQTISKRERGVLEVDTEAALAIWALASGLAPEDLRRAPSG